MPQSRDTTGQAGSCNPVRFSQWAAPIVPVLKRDGSIRICEDYKVTVNLTAETDTYLLPKIEDLFASLSGGKLFLIWSMLTKKSFWRSSQKNTPLLTLTEDSTAFGVASALSIFQCLCLSR